MTESLLAFAFAVVGLALAPGPDNIYVITQSLAHGAKSGIATTAGLISGCIVHTALLAFGVSAMIAASDALFFAIKLFGAAYLLWLAYKVYMSPSSIDLDAATEEKQLWELFKIGVVMNLVNPKVMLFFLALFPAFLWDKQQDTSIQFLVLGAVFMLVSFVVFSSLALLAGKISGWIKRYPWTGTLLKWLQIVVFVGIAVFIWIP